MHIGSMLLMHAPSSQLISAEGGLNLLVHLVQESFFCRDLPSGGLPHCPTDTMVEQTSPLHLIPATFLPGQHECLLPRVGRCLAWALVRSLILTPSGQGDFFVEYGRTFIHMSSHQLLYEVLQPWTRVCHFI